jgi:hypothetical protein
MNGTWVKFFTDGTQEHGSDIDIANRTASWSRGRLSDVTEVSISEGTRSVHLNAEDTEWHQFDRFVIPVATGTHRPQRTHRVIQAKIQPHHVGLLVEMKKTSTITLCSLVGDKTKYTGEERIIEDDVGLWLTVILPAKDKPYAVIAERGKIKEKDE